VFRVSGQNASWSLTFGGFSGTSFWEEAPVQTQDSLDGLYVPSSLGMPQVPSRAAGECHWGGVVWVSLLDLLPPRPDLREADENRWMDGLTASSPLCFNTR